MTAVRRPILAALLLASAMLTPLGAAHADDDTLPPQVTLDPFGHYQRNSQIATDDDPDAASSWAAHYLLTWEASDPSGICAQTITEQSYDTLGGSYDPVLGYNTLTYSVEEGDRSHAYATNEMNWQRGGASFVVRVTDCAGNQATSTVARTTFGIREDTAAHVIYRGPWRVRHDADASGGTTHVTRRAGSSMTVRVHGGRPLALVMERGPHQADADIFVDGGYVRTVRTSRAVTTPRVVVWQALLEPGRHVIEVVSAAVPGSRRLSVDAVLL